VWRFVADGFVLAFAAPNRIGRASLYHKARLIQINAALIRRVNFQAGGCEEFMKVHAIRPARESWPPAPNGEALMTLFITHPACHEHRTPPDHPERPDRLRTIEQVLEHERFTFLQREQCPRAELEIVALCHPWEYIDRIRSAVPQIGLVHLDDDTVLSAGSFEASLRAAGGAILAVDEIMSGKAKNAFVAIRPAGHHAESTTAMGFCLFNNAAIAVRHAQRRYGAERVAIVDFDAHHGNGSQQIFWSDRAVMYCSTHEMPLFPGTGEWSECGEYNNVVNVPLRAGDGGETFREALDIAILPRLQNFSPDLIVISAGFDAHRLDPLANLNLSEADFGWATRKIVEIADLRSAGKVISVLEGGYALQSLAHSVAAHVTALMES
jgi:acetoin utilization deacetylase AcuC-like enzyme